MGHFLTPTSVRPPHAVPSTSWVTVSLKHWPLPQPWPLSRGSPVSHRFLLTPGGWIRGGAWLPPPRQGWSRLKDPFTDLGTQTDQVTKTPRSHSCTSQTRAEGGWHHLPGLLHWALVRAPQERLPHDAGAHEVHEVDQGSGHLRAGMQVRGAPGAAPSSCLRALRSGNRLQGPRGMSAQKCSSGVLGRRPHQATQDPEDRVQPGAAV